MPDWENSLVANDREWVSRTTLINRCAYRLAIYAQRVKMPCSRVSRIRPLRTQTCHHFAVLIVAVLKGTENVTAAHIDWLYMLHVSRCCAQGYGECDRWAHKLAIYASHVKTPCSRVSRIRPLRTQTCHHFAVLMVAVLKGM